MNEILRQLHGEDIYAGFDADAFPEDTQPGWGGISGIFERQILKVRPKIIVEVGTWKGQSAITMAEWSRRHGIENTVICVDTWLGSDEHWCDEACRRELRQTNGFPRVYLQFLSNVIRHGLQDRIVPLPSSSLTAASVLYRIGIRPNLTYIDANHETDAVLLDMDRYWNLTVPGGTMFGHDYACWPSVQEAVKTFCAHVSLIPTIQGDFWIIEKPLCHTT